MRHTVNSLGQPIGPDLPGWKPPPRPSREPMAGRFCRVEALDADLHGADLHAANSEDAEGRIWTYLGYGPFETRDAYLTWARGVSTAEDPIFFAIVDLPS